MGLTYLNPDAIKDASIEGIKIKDGSISSSKIDETVASKSYVDTAIEDNYKGGVTSVNVDNVSKTPSNGVVDLGYINKQLITTTSSTMTLSPNIYYRNTNIYLYAITITLESISNSNIINEYFVEFTTSDFEPIISLPSTIKWANGNAPTFEKNTTYQISIVNDLGIVTKFN